MSKFRGGARKKMPAMSTASLPDIVFMLLFFFMVTTVMRETTLMVKVKTPLATEIKKMEKKSLISYIYIGKPIKSQQKKMGKNVQIQLNDAFANVNDIPEFILDFRKNKEADIPKMTTSIKADESAKMGIISDVKQELRKVNALKINYSTRKGEY